MTHKVKISGQVRPSLEIDGRQVDASSAVLSLEATSLPVLAVELPVVGDLDVGVEAVVYLTERTAKTLEAMGWTPPPEWTPDASR